LVIGRLELGIRIGRLLRGPRGGGIRAHDGRGSGVVPRAEGEVGRVGRARARYAGAIGTSACVSRALALATGGPAGDAVDSIPIPFLIHWPRRVQEVRPRVVRCARRHRRRYLFYSV
jgi:hypothetical protein